MFGAEPDFRRANPTGTRELEGVIKLEDGLILIHDLDKFLSLEEEASLDVALDST